MFEIFALSDQFASSNPQNKNLLTSTGLLLFAFSKMRANQRLRLRSLRANKISLDSLLKNGAFFKSSDFEILTRRQAEKKKIEKK